MPCRRTGGYGAIKLLSGVPPTKFAAYWRCKSIAPARRLLLNALLRHQAKPRLLSDLGRRTTQGSYVPRPRLRDEEATTYFFRKEKKARLQVVNVAILEKRNDMISKQLALLDRNKDVFIRTHDQKTYDDRVMALLDQLPNPVADVEDKASDEGEVFGDEAEGDEDVVAHDDDVV